MHVHAFDCFDSVGQGQFGKVYSAVNTDTGQMMAVKEIRFQPNDHQTIKDVAEEIKIFEDLDHPGLVMYYGVEIHRVSKTSSCLRSNILRYFKTF